MKLWRVLLTVYSDPAAEWHSADHRPTFYVHGLDAQCARYIALATAGATLSNTSGSLIEVDADLDPLLDTYFSWSAPS